MPTPEPPTPREAHDVTLDAVLLSAVRSAEFAESCGVAHNRIILSAKLSSVPELVTVYRRLASRCDCPLHVGLTEAGLGTKGIGWRAPRLWRFSWRMVSGTRFVCRSLPGLAATGRRR